MLYATLLLNGQELLYTGSLALIHALADSVMLGGTVTVHSAVKTEAERMEESYEAYIDDRLSMYAHS
jgi:hypothetical protein